MSQIKLRQGTAAAWTSANPVLAMGEEGFETDTKKKKTGDGATAWASLAYNSASTGGGLLAANNLSDVASATTARTNLGLGTIATKAATTGSAVQKADGSGGLTGATVGVDFAAPLYVAQFGTTTASVTNTTSDTTLWTPATVPAASLVAATTILRVRIGGTLDAQITSGTFTIKLKVGGTQVASLPIAVSQGAARTVSWWGDVDLFVDVTGASGQVTAQGQCTAAASAGALSPSVIETTTTALNLSSNLALTVVGSMATASASNILRLIRGVSQQIA